MSKKSADPWAVAVKTYLKSELGARNLAYADLIPLLAAVEVEESESGFRNKLSRGTFPATFFIQVLRALGIDSIDLNSMAPPNETRQQ